MMRCVRHGRARGDAARAAELSACDTAETELAEVCSELGVPWEVSDVDADAELRAEFGDRVPVILVDGAEHGFWKVEPQRLRSALTR